MLRLEISLEDLERIVERRFDPVPLHISEGRLHAKKFGAELALGPVQCEVSRGMLVLPLEIVGAIGGALGRAAARAVIFSKLQKVRIPELSVDDARSALLLDSRLLLGRLGPGFADYHLSELSFVDKEARGLVVLTLLSSS
ncbi:MAG TPA: hypothetical protein VK843_14425 [Planctomycetota bacterium]|nr:hypothetical protein [Planctomycetota bacterium]